MGNVHKKIIYIAYTSVMINKKDVQFQLLFIIHEYMVIYWYFNYSMFYLSPIYSFMASIHTDTHVSEFIV